jgi:hypothetical protein
VTTTVLEVPLDNTDVARSLYTGLSFDNHSKYAHVIDSAKCTWHAHRLDNGVSPIPETSIATIVVSDESIQVTIKAVSE